MGVIGCRDAVERLWTYLDDELDETDRQAVDEHLAFCLRCCGEVAFARELRRTLAVRSEPALPDDVRRRLEGFIGCLEEPTGTS
jgi:anti-sigma factor RsiW